MSRCELCERCSSSKFKRPCSACNAGLRVLWLSLCSSVSCRLHYEPRFDDESWNLNSLSVALLCHDSLSSTACLLPRWLVSCAAIRETLGSLSRPYMARIQWALRLGVYVFDVADGCSSAPCTQVSSPVAVAEPIEGTMQLQRIDVLSRRAPSSGRFCPVDSGIDVCTGCRLRTASHIQCRFRRERNSRCQHHDRADRHGHGDRVSLSLFSSGCFQARGRQRSNRSCMMLCINGFF